MASKLRTPLIAGNWKMNGSLAASEALVQQLVAGVGKAKHAEMLVCPPYLYLDRAREWLAGSAVALGGQDICAEPGFGAYTGEISGTMLAEFRCDYVIVGHSERRALYGETDSVVTEKFRASQAVGIVPILCCGESRAEREAGSTGEVVARQIGAVIDGVGVAAFRNAVIAYEPIWAIGTGLTASPEQAQEVHALIRGLVAASDATIAGELRILYGGSVKGANAADLLGQDDIDGGLVGGASLDAVDFLRIFEAAE
jgi:triosephosphate isomerase